MILDINLHGSGFQHAVGCLQNRRHLCPCRSPARLEYDVNWQARGDRAITVENDQSRPSFPVAIRLQLQYYAV
jgi:hypothetical protein